jgi:hypothetical protein
MFEIRKAVGNSLKTCGVSDFQTFYAGWVKEGQSSTFEEDDYKRTVVERKLNTRDFCISLFMGKHLSKTWINNLGFLQRMTALQVCDCSKPTNFYVLQKKQMGLVFLHPFLGCRELTYIPL